MSPLISIPMLRIKVFIAIPRVHAWSALPRTARMGFDSVRSMESAQTPWGHFALWNSLRTPRCLCASAQAHGSAVTAGRRRKRLSSVGRHDRAPAVYGPRANPGGLG